LRGKNLITGLVVLAAVATGIAMSGRTWQVWRDQREIADSQSTEMRESEANRERLLKEEARVKSAIGREELARKMGYVGKGEVPADDR